MAEYTVYGNCDEIVYEKFDLGFDLLRGSYVDEDLLRGFNFEPFAGKIDDSTCVENLGPKSGTALTVHLVTTQIISFILLFFSMFMFYRALVPWIRTNTPKMRHFGGNLIQISFSGPTTSRRPGDRPLI